MLNRFEGIGNLGADPELRYSTGQNQTAICRFSIAVQKGYGEHKKTVWINVVTFGKLADNCQKFLAKGRKVYVAGELDIREYDKQDGTKGYITEVSANTVEFLNSNEGNGFGQQAQPARSNPQQYQQPQSSYPPAGQQPMQPDQNMTYQQYQEQRKYEEMQGQQQMMPTDVAGGFQGVRDDDIPF